jgi:hypothetical protein
MTTEVFVHDYTEKAIAVFGNTKPYMEEIKNAGGKYNHNLKYNGTTSPGWVFPKTKLTIVKQLVDKINEGKITPSEPKEHKENKEYKENKQSKDEKKEQPVNDKNVMLSKDEFIYIMNTLTRLEQEVAALKRQASGNKIEHYIKKTSEQKEQKKVIKKEESSEDDNDYNEDDNENDDDNEEEEEEEEQNKANKSIKVVTVSKGPSLLRKK